MKCVTGAASLRREDPSTPTLLAVAPLEWSPMRVGVARETAPGERRVALVPETAAKLAAAGFEIVVEPGAGAAASFPDDAYAEAGATLGDPCSSETLVKVRKPDESEVARLDDG